MPLLRNKTTNTKFIADMPLYPLETKEMVGYPDPGDPDVEIVSHDPVWRLGMTGPSISDAITTVKTYTVPKGTNNIEIINMSAGSIKMYNHERGDTGAADYVDWGLPIGTNQAKVFVDIKNKIYTFEIYGTTAAGEVTVTFTE